MTMSKYRNVPIRKVKYLNGKPGVLQALKNVSRPIPLFYQYSQQKLPPTKIDERYQVGVAKNIRISGDDVVCDVVITDTNVYASQFDYKIDNYTLKPIKDGKHYEVCRFVIYNKDFKRKVDMKMSEIDRTKKENEEQKMSVITEIAAAESIPELHREAPVAD